jgi:hypothetical protein
MFVSAQTMTTPPLPIGMRVQVGGTGALLRASPLTYTCDTPPVECTTQDVIAANVYGVVQSDPPVLDPAGWYWSRVVFDAKTPNGEDTGWVSAIPPYINVLTPPQMISGVAFSIAGSYGPGPILTNAVCINDGLASAATMQLQNVTCCSDNGPGQQGTLICPWPKAGVGNHKVVIQAVNTKGTAQSDEFQFIINAAPVGVNPTQPNNLRITSGNSPAVTSVQPAPEK